jgi:hypothetical protein
MLNTELEIKKGRIKSCPDFNSQKPLKKPEQR